MKPPLVVVASLVALALVGALTVAAAEDQPEPAGVHSIEDTNWLLAAQDVGGEMTPLDEGVVISLRLTGGEAGGSGGCNSYGASYRLDELDIDVFLRFATQMGCGAPRAAAEDTYFANLERVASYQPDGTRMVLVDDDGEPVLEFAEASPSMVLGSWSVGMVSDGAGSLDGNQHTARMTARFSEDGSLAGTDGCNDYSGTYELDGEAIDIGPITITDRQCPKKRQRTFAQRYYAALAATSSWSIGMHGLQLLDEDGAVQAVYHRVE